MNRLSCAVVSTLFIGIVGITAIVAVVADTAYHGFLRRLINKR